MIYNNWLLMLKNLENKKYIQNKYKKMFKIYFIIFCMNK